LRNLPLASGRLEGESVERGPRIGDVEVAVDRGRQLRVGVAEHLLDGGERYAVLEEESGRRVAVIPRAG